MPRHRRFELEELANRPGTYFNPQTEVLIVVDDAQELGHEIFSVEELESDEWVLVSDSAPIDESVRDELLESFKLANRPDAPESDDGDDVDDEELDEEDLPDADDLAEADVLDDEEDLDLG
jgi:hypothetical protein